MTRLFQGDSEPTDTRWYSNLRAGRSEPARRIRDFCEQVFSRFEEVLDPDFRIKFRRSTPASFSELFFAAAFEQSGLSPLPRTPTFDLTFRTNDARRILVEVVTPNPPAESSWRHAEHGRYSSYSTDQGTFDETLLRLTSAFKRKADAIQEARLNGRINPADFCIVAICGIRISQESPVLLSVGGRAPDFAKAFLPIGPLEVSVVPSGQEGEPPIWGDLTHSYRSRIPKGDKGVDQKAFVSGDFGHVDAVAYTNAHLDNLKDASDQVSLLYNPTSPLYTIRPDILVGAQYEIDLRPDEFTLRGRFRQGSGGLA